MLNEIDDFVIDHGFQPIVNRLLMHPMDVAMITTTGASVLLATGTIIGVDWTNYTVVPIVVVAIMAQFCALWVSRQTFPRMKSLIKPGNQQKPTVSAGAAGDHDDHHHRISSAVFEGVVSVSWIRLLAYHDILPSL
jgi:hypothetical protein